MAIQDINIGTTANDGTGDSLRAAGQKLNDNFSELQQPVITEFTTSQIFNGTQKGTTNIYKINSASNLTVELNPDDYSQGEVVIISRGEDGGTVEITAATGKTHKGVRNVSNRFFINDPNSFAACILDSDGKFLITGNITSGYNGAVTTSNYTALQDTGIAQDVTVTGTNFSANMVVSLTGNGTLNSWTYVSETEITLNITETGTIGDNLTLTYDNGDIFIDTDAITIQSTITYLADSYPFPYGWGLLQMDATQTYAARVRRSSDSAETDVGFDSNQVVSLSSPVAAGGTLTTWAGSDDVFVVTMYNQGSGGATFDLTQSTVGNQAKLLSAGALITQGGRTFIEFDGSNDLYSTTGTDTWANGQYSVFGDVRSKSAKNGMILGQFRSTQANRILQLYYNATNVITGIYADETGGGSTTANSGSVSINTNYDVAGFKGAVNCQTFVNGTGGTAQTSPATNPSESLGFDYGSLTDYSATTLDGYNSYVVVYKSDQIANESNIRTLITSFL